MNKINKKENVEDKKSEYAKETESPRIRAETAKTSKWILKLDER